jgi:Domain of unknown function (DUF4129)
VIGARLPLRLGPAAVAACGLILAFAGVLASDTRGSGGALAGPLTAPLPEWLVLATAAAIGSAALLFLALVFGAPRRRRKKDDEFVEYTEPRKLHPAMALLLLLLALSPGAILAGVLLWFQPSGAPAWQAGSLGQAEYRALSPSAPGEQVPRPVPPLTEGLFAVLALALGLGGLGVVAWLWAAGRPGHDGAGPQMRALFGAAATDSLGDIAGEPDARRAIIKAYRHFERALAAARLPRRPWETPAEFMRAALGLLPLPAEPVTALTRLFEVARFSRHPLGRADRDAVLHALTEIRTRLAEAKEGDGAPG